MKLTAVVTLMGFIAIGGAILSFHRAEAAKLQASSIVDICALNPGLQAAINDIFTRWPPAEPYTSKEIYGNLIYFELMVRQDKAWCEKNSDVSNPDLVLQTMLWHYGNASEFMRQYQAMMQASAAAPPAPTPTATPTSRPTSTTTPRPAATLTPPPTSTPVAPAVPVGIGTNFASLNGTSYLLGFRSDGGGQYLGDISSDCYAANSIVNSYGDYGSRYSDSSIRNEYGDWGSRYSDRSATNPYATDPPLIISYSDHKAFAYLTENRYVAGQAIDTSDLLGYLVGVGGCR